MWEIKGQTQESKAKSYLGRVFRGTWLKFGQGESSVNSDILNRDPLPSEAWVQQEGEADLKKAGGERLLQGPGKRK